ENLVIFGLTAEEVLERQRAEFTGSSAVEASPRLSAVVDSLSDGTFSPDDPDRYVPIVKAICEYDRFMVAADFEAYWAAQRRVDQWWRSPRDWWRASILNTARMSWFSSDRAVRDYAREIWGVQPGV